MAQEDRKIIPANGDDLNAKRHENADQSATQKTLDEQWAVVLHFLPKGWPEAAGTWGG